MKKHNSFLLSLALLTTFSGITNLNAQKSLTVAKAPQKMVASASAFMTNYDEPYRPQFHFSPRVGWMNDINGVWYQNGVYHVSYQANPHGLEWANMHWGHAISTDMMHWVEQPVMLEPDVNVPGACYSGSTVVDVNNTSGFKTGTNAPLVTIYTATTKGTCLAYSNDQGATWVAYSGNPVNVAGPNADTRDPHVFWHEPTGKWICVIMENGFTFYSSPNLKTWTKISNINWGWECPDFFELPVDGGATKKWVLLEADAKYYTGTFDGTTFVRDAGGPYNMVNNSGIGAGFYASQTYFSPTFPSNRIVQMGWMSGLSAGNTAPWTHNSSFPCELKLKTFHEGVRVTRNPIAEISNLYKSTKTWGSQTLPANQNLFAGLLSKCFDLEVVVNTAQSTASTINFQVANKIYTYDITNKKFLGGTINPINNEIKIRLLVDWDIMEAFVNDGQFSHAENYKFTPSTSSVAMTANGSVSLVSARFSAIDRVWPGTASNNYADDPDASNVYTGNWRVSTGESGYYNGTLHLSNTTGAYVEYNFTGTQISWFALKNNDLGMATVYIDGQLAADNIDCYSTERYVQQMFTKTDLPAGKHTIKVMVKGTKNSLSAGYYIVHDYFSTVSSPVSPTAADDADPKTAYTGTWITDKNDIYYNTICHVSNSAGSFFQYEFTGTQVYWYGLKNNDLGKAAVYIDGVLAANDIDCYSNTKFVDLLFCKTNLSNTTHTIKVEVKGTKNAESSGTAIVHDYFDFPTKPVIYVDDTDSRTIYTGSNWIFPSPEGIYYNSTCHVSATTNAYWEFNFNGSKIDWYGLKNNDLGYASVYIDGVFVTDIDCYSANRAVYKLFSTNTLSKSNHTIKIVVKGTKNASSKGIALVHDYFVVPDIVSIDVNGDLNFGNVQLSSTNTKIMTISNISDSPLDVTNITLPEGFTADWTAGEVPAQQDKKVNIDFNPSVAKTYGGKIKIVSNAEAGIDSIAVSGAGSLSNALNEIDGIEMQIYPNPVQNTLRVVTKDLCNIEISDIAGKVVFNKMMEGNTTTIDMSAFTSGVFFLKAVNAKGEFSIQKTIKT